MLIEKWLKFPRRVHHNRKYFLSFERFKGPCHLDIVWGGGGGEINTWFARTNPPKNDVAQTETRTKLKLHQSTSREDEETKE
jgi:hypothetical protein